MTTRRRKPPTEDGDLLSIWRSKSPAEAAEALDRLSAALLARAQTLPEGLALPAAVVLRAEARDPMAWIMFAARLPRLLEYAHRPGSVGTRNMDSIDVEGSCLWVAASYRLPWAWTLITFRLLRLAKQEGGKLGLAYQALAIRCAHVGDIVSPLPVDAASDLGILAEITSPPPKAETRAPATPVAEAETASPEDHRPTLRVLASVPPPSASREDKALIDRYAELARPVEMVPMPDPDRLAESLLAEFPWMPEIVDAIRSDLVLAQRLGCDAFRLPPLLLTGASGVGKSRFARRLAVLAGVPAGQLMASGASDNKALAGTARGWSSTQPCLPVLTMQVHRRANPIIVVDGIDDAGGSARNGAIDRTLVGMLDPATARAWQDDCLLVPADLSWVTWILIARRADRVSADLRSRCRVLQAPWPRPEDFEVIISGALADVAAEYGSEVRDLPELEPEIVDALRNGFVSGRLQARQLGTIVRRTLAAAAGLERAALRH